MALLEATRMLYVIFTRCDCFRELHEARFSVPPPIREYINEVQAHLENLTAHRSPEITSADKLTFLRETRHAFGRTALVLSGGGALGAFHVVRLSLVDCP